tara:strand:- start:186 stop:671 length:486 start_codon:yes stop_codon:yes gene_type:complete
MIAPLARKFNHFIKNPKVFARGMSFWPPFVGAGIRVDHISEDFREIEVSMRLGVKNSNYVGTHFGGSLYAMTDPFYMLMFLHNLDRSYIVWDKSAHINFKKPGKGKVTAHFKLEQEDIEHVISDLEDSERGSILWEKMVYVKDESGDVVAEINKVVYIKKK